MDDEKRQHTDAEIDACVEDIKAEILADIGVVTSARTHEVMPETISSFSELHDFVDANMYGGLCDPESRSDFSLGDVIAVQEKVDAWLKDGGHRTTSLQEHTFTVTVKARTKGMAERVMAERCGYDEDYGFEYQINWKEPT